MIAADDIKWTFKTSLNLSNQHHTVLRNDELGVQCEKLTNKTLEGGCGKCRTFFFIDHDDREFLTIDELVDAYNEKFKFNDENPEHEVKYIRVVVKRDAKKKT